MAGWHWGALLIIVVVALIVGKKYGSTLPLISAV